MSITILQTGLVPRSPILNEDIQEWLHLRFLRRDLVSVRCCYRSLNFKQSTRNLVMGGHESAPLPCRHPPPDRHPCLIRVYKHFTPL